MPCLLALLVGLPHQRNASSRPVCCGKVNTTKALSRGDLASALSGACLLPAACPRVARSTWRRSCRSSSLSTSSGRPQFAPRKLPLLRQFHLSDSCVAGTQENTDVRRSLGCVPSPAQYFFALRPLRLTLGHLDRDLTEATVAGASISLLTATTIFLLFVMVSKHLPTVLPQCSSARLVCCLQSSVVQLVLAVVLLKNTQICVVLPQPALVSELVARRSAQKSKRLGSSSNSPLLVTPWRV